MTIIDHNKMKLLAEKDCPICLGAGITEEGEVDDSHTVPCVCTISDPADFSGATEGDR